MADFPSPFRLAESAAVSLFAKGLGALPLKAASGLGAGLMGSVGPRLSISKRARRNLSRVFDPARVDELLPKVWANLGRTFFEYPHIRAMARAGLVEVQGREVMERLVHSGKGTLFFSGHLSNWEVLSLLPGLGAFDAKLMYRAPGNPDVDRVLLNCRGDDRVGYIQKSTSGTKEAFNLLASGGVLGFLIDHRYNRGVEVDFLGGKALVATTAAVMAQKFRCPLVPTRVERLEPGRYRITVHEPLDIDYSQPRDQFSQVVMQQAMSMIESWVLERPDQWFWMQRLWV
ncbi:MAG: lysophospholipid acyltransferase family protein [Actinomycetota bacterium]